MSYSHHVLRKSCKCDNSDVFLTSTARGDQKKVSTIAILSILKQYEEHSLDGEASNAVVRYSILFYFNWCKRCLDILSIHMCTLCNKLYCRSYYFGIIVHFQISINLRESYPLVFQFIPMVIA